MSISFFQQTTRDDAHWLSFIGCSDARFSRLEALCRTRTGNAHRASMTGNPPSESRRTHRFHTGPIAMRTAYPPLFLAPMAGVTDLAYRLLASECGADYTVTEFTAASGLTRRNTNSWLKVESDPRENPFIPQIFGGWGMN